jgi:decaprenylphospho-beta-D-ribofuranose 2-oxidase
MTRGVTIELAGWGRAPSREAVEVVGENLRAAVRGARLTRGLGRSYGDASLPPHVGARIAASRRADRLLAFDPGTATLRAEAGLSLVDLSEWLWPRGFAIPVVPGTAHVTLGGMVAADVHGKNHHGAGTIGAHLRALRLALADGRELEVSETSEPELFRATQGGMGLTAHVLEVELSLERIPSPWIRQETEPIRDLDELLERLPSASSRWPFTVAWVDVTATGRALGRGAIVSGRWAERDEAPASAPGPRFRPTLPFVMPDWVLNRASARLVNAAYGLLNGKRSARVVDPRSHFHPLDVVLEWNRAYGRRGFTQYQALIPREAGPGAVRRLFKTLAASGEPAFLCVVKDFGAEGAGLLSFPRPGTTASIDLPLRGARTQALVDDLNRCVLEAGGRVYLAKDALTRREDFQTMEGPRLAAFDAVRRRFDPERKLSSALAVRLLGDPA